MFTREELEQLGIGKLRDIARRLGIPGQSKWTKADKEIAIEAILSAPRKESDPDAIRSVRAKIDEIVVLLERIDPTEHVALLAPLYTKRVKVQDRGIIFTESPLSIDGGSPKPEMVHIPVPEMVHIPTPIQGKPEFINEGPFIGHPLEAQPAVPAYFVASRGALTDYVEEQNIDVEIPMYYRQVDLDFRLAIPSAGVHKVKGDEDLNLVLNDVQKPVEETRVSFPDVEYNIRKCLGLT